MADFPEIFKSIFYVVLLITLFSVGFYSAAQFQRTVYNIDYETALEEATFLYLMRQSCLIERTIRGEAVPYVFDYEKIKSRTKNVGCALNIETDKENVVVLKGELENDCVPLLGEESEDEFDYVINIKIPYKLKIGKSGSVGISGIWEESKKKGGDIEEECLKRVVNTLEGKSKKDMDQYIVLKLTNRDGVEVHRRHVALLKYKEKHGDKIKERYIPVIVEYGILKKVRK